MALGMASGISFENTFGNDFRKCGMASKMTLRIASAIFFRISFENILRTCVNVNTTFIVCSSSNNNVFYLFRAMNAGSGYITSNSTFVIPKPLGPGIPIWCHPSTWANTDTWGDNLHVSHHFKSMNLLNRPCDTHTYMIYLLKNHDSWVKLCEECPGIQGYNVYILHVCLSMAFILLLFQFFFIR